jgi:single-stranded-DNA-specific exonuclease
VHASWIARQPPPAIETLDRLEASGLTRELASLLAARGVSTPAEAAAFLDPGIDSLHDPLLLKGMKEALDLLLAAHSRGERVAVIGDYDVDGITATALLLGVFQAVGIAAHGILPNRHAGGYGPQPQHMQQAEELGCRLVVTADCGIRAYEALAEAAPRTSCHRHRSPSAGSSGSTPRRSSIRVRPAVLTRSASSPASVWR